MAPRLLERYRKEIVKVFIEKHGFKGSMHAPSVSKVVLSMGVKEGTSDVKVLEDAAEDVGKITGQKPLITHAKKSIAGFALRKGQPIGLKVTLRRARMYEFMDRFFSVAVPRMRDFRGFHEKGFDNQGNYTLGVQEQVIFPEINFDEVRKIRGMNITFVTTSKDKKMSRLLLEYLGMPFRKVDEKR